MSTNSTILSNSQSSLLNLSTNRKKEAVINKYEMEMPVILLVDHDKELLANLNKELKSQYVILRASNASEVDEILNQHKIHLVITEVVISGTDGLSLCRTIKSTALFSHIPVVFLTSHKELEMKIQVLNSGADDYIEKPFSLDFLKAQIENILFNRQKVKNYFSSSPSIYTKKSLRTHPADQFMDKLYSIIEESISDMDVSVNLLAKLMNVSRATLYRKISNYTQLKPNELIKQAKLERSAELLLLKKFTVSQIASMVGYSEQSNFSRDFYKYFGMRPSNYINVVENGNSFAC